MEVSSLNLPGLALDFPWDVDIGVQGDLDTTVTTSTAVMPVLVSHGHHPTAAVNNTLPLDPSFVDIDHLSLGRKTPVPSRRSKTSVVGSGSTRTRTTSSSTPPSKLRSVSTPTPPTSVHPTAPRSSSKSRGHRSTKSHGQPHQEDHIQEDLLLNLLKEFRIAKKKERENGGGGSTDAGTGSVSLSLGVKSLLSHASRRPQQHHESKAAQDRDQASSPPSYDSTTRPGSPVGARPAALKTRERSASTSTPPKLRTRSKSTSGSSSEIVILLGSLRQETKRANTAEAQLNELTERYKVMRQEKSSAEGQLAVIREELRLYKEQLDAAQKEIFRAQQIVDSVDRQRVLAEQEAQRNKERCRKLFEERLVAQAQEEGRREGYEEGVRRGRLAREEQERQVEFEREQERAKRRREKERERQRRDEERMEREREREEMERRERDRERMEMERRERVRLELERLRRDREERERREREKMEEARRERERLEDEQMERRRQEEARRIREEESRRKEYEDWDRKTKHQPTQRARSNTLGGATAPPATLSASHRSRARSGSVPGPSRPTNGLPPPPRPSTPLAPPPLPAKPSSPEHRAARSRTPAPRSHTPHVPTAGPSTTPAGDPPPHHARRSSPPNPNFSTASMQYVPLPQPPANYIPVMNKDGSVPVPPPFGFKSPPRNNDGAAPRPPPRPSSRAADSVRGYANPDRERMRQRIIGAGSPETPTPRPGSVVPGGARPFSRQGDVKGKGKMRVVNEEHGGGPQDRPPTDSPPNGFPWFAPASEVTYPTVDPPTPPPSSNPNRHHMPVAPAMFMSTPLQKVVSPPPPGPGHGNANQSARSSGDESRWMVPPDFSYAGGHPTMTPMLVRTATNGTTPTIGVEPPSHSPTTVAEISTALDSGLLTADGTVAHHEREAEEHDHQSPPSTTTPQSYPYQPGPLPTPTDTTAPWNNYTSPPQGQPPQYQRYDTNASWVSNWMNPNPVPPPQWGAMGGSPGSASGSGLGSGSVQDKNLNEWVPPPIVPLSPIPGTMSMDYKFNAFAPPSSAGSPRVVSPGSEKEVLTFGMGGATGTEKFLSPAPLNRPISLFSDSDS